MTSTTVSCPPAGLSPASQRRARQLAALPAGGSRLAESSPQGRRLLEAVAGLESGPSLNQSLTDPRMTTGPSRSLCLQPAVPAPLILYHGSRELCVITHYCLAESLYTVKMTSGHRNIRMRRIPPPKKNILFNQRDKFCCAIVWMPAKKKILHLFIFQYV